MPAQPPGRHPAAPPRRPGWFVRLSPGGRTGVILGGVLLSVFLACCSGLAVIGAFTDSPQQDRKAAADNETARSAAGPIVAATTATETTPAPSTPVATSAAPTPTPTSATPSPSPQVEIRTETETQTIRYGQRTVKDPNLAEGKRVVRTRGVNGVRILTYEVTLTDGVQTGRRLVRSVVTKQPVTQVIAVGTKQKSQCDPNYSGCVPIASDVDCAGGSGDGPAYVTGPVKVIGSDIYRLDHDHDGYGCDE